MQQMATAGCETEGPEITIVPLTTLIMCHRHSGPTFMTKLVRVSK